MNRSRRTHQEQRGISHLFPTDGRKPLKEFRPAQLAGDHIESQQDYHQIHAVAPAAGVFRDMITRLFHGLLPVADNVLRILNAHGEAGKAIMELLRVQVLPLVVPAKGHNEALIVSQRYRMDELGVGSNGRRHIGGIRRVRDGGLHAEFVVQRGEKQSAESRRTGGRRHAVLTALQRRDPLLQILLVGAAVAGIEVGTGAGPVHIRGVIGQGAAVGHGDGPLNSAAVLVHHIANMNRTGGKTVICLFLLSAMISPHRYKYKHSMIIGYNSMAVLLCQLIN